MGLRTQRLDKPTSARDRRLCPASWPEAFAAIAAKVKAAKPDRSGAIAGDLCAVEEDVRAEGADGPLGRDQSSIAGRTATASIRERPRQLSFSMRRSPASSRPTGSCSSAQPAPGSPVLNARIRKRWRASNLKIGSIGEKADLTYDYAYLGAGPDSLADFVNHAPAKLERQIWLIGQGALARPDGAAILSMAAKAAVSVGAIKDGWNGFSILHTAAARVGALDIGFVPGERGKSATEMAKAGAVNVLFNLGADEIDIADGAFVVYIGTHGDRGAHRADVILPGAPTRKSPASTSTPKGACRWRRARASRRAMRARTGRSSARSPTCSGRSCLRLARRIARRAVQGAPASRAHRSDRAGQCRGHREARPGRHARQGAVPLAGHGLLSHQPDRARLRHHGGMLALARGERAVAAE
jgi:NADH-quinone oxidoreductase subunit G